MHFAIVNEIEDVPAPGGHNLELYMGMLLLEKLQQAGQGVHRKVTGSAETKGTGYGVADVQRLLPDFLELQQHFGRGFGEKFPLGRELYSFAGAVDNFYAEFFFDLLQSGGQRRLRSEQRLRRLGDALLFVQDLQDMPVPVFHHWIPPHRFIIASSV